MIVLVDVVIVQVQQICLQCQVFVEFVVDGEIYLVIGFGVDWVVVCVVGMCSEELVMLVVCIVDGLYVVFEEFDEVGGIVDIYQVCLWICVVGVVVEFQVVFYVGVVV